MGGGGCPPTSRSLYEQSLFFLLSLLSCRKDIVNTGVHRHSQCTFCSLLNSRRKIGTLSLLSLGQLDTFGQKIGTACSLHRRDPTAVRHRCAQRCDSKNEHSAVTAMVWIVMLQRWDISGCDTDVTAMFTLV